MPGHWVLARLGKRVLRPGGLELTRFMLEALGIGPQDDVVEFAPGLGVTARMTLLRRPRSYVAVERDRQAAAAVEHCLAGSGHRVVLGTAEETGLPSGSATAVYGEAMLSMQAPSAKAKIVAEAARLLVPGGRYGIHELCLAADDTPQQVHDAIERELSDQIHVGVRLLAPSEWQTLLESAGLSVTAKRIAPMHLLEPRRIIRDEGIAGALRFGANLLLHRDARRRVMAMRRAFRRFADHLRAISLVARKNAEVRS
jgi:hypothetical protein